MRRLMPSIFLLLGALPLTGCGNIALQMFSGNPTVIQGLSPSTDGASFEQRCGRKASEFGDPSRVLVDQKMTSMPIVLSGVKSDISIKLTLQGQLHIRAMGGMSVTETRVKVVNLEAGDGGRFSKAEADNAARDNSNRKTSWGMSSGLLLKLQKSDKAFAGILCSVGFTAKMKLENSGGTGVISFDPGIPGAVNFNSTPENLLNELGESRSFTSVAKISQQATGWAPVGTTATVTTTVKKLSGSIASIPGIPANIPKFTADLVYEVTNSSPGRDVATLGLSRRQVFFINSEKKSLVAAMDDSGKISPIDNQPLPPTFAVIDQ
jgi:hypothetical protein